MFFSEDPSGTRSSQPLICWTVRLPWRTMRRMKSPGLQGRSVTPGCCLDDVSFPSNCSIHFGVAIYICTVILRNLREELFEIDVPFASSMGLSVFGAQKNVETLGSLAPLWCRRAVHCPAGKTGKNSQSIFPSKYPVKRCKKWIPSHVWSPEGWSNSKTHQW